MSETLVTVRDLVVRYRAPGRAKFEAVSRVGFEIEAGETVALVGESGSGKSSIARAIAGLQPPATGSVHIDGRDIWALGERDRRRLRRDVQFIFQDPYASLNPRMSVGTALDRPLRLHSCLDRRERRARVYELLDEVGLSSEHARRHPSELSGGQRQRVAIARALAPEPKLLVADEPTASLDVSVQAQVLALLRRLAAEHRLTVLLVTHDFAAVRGIAGRVLVMHLGEIVEAGSVDDVIGSSAHPYTRALLSAVPRPGVSAADRLRLLGPPLSPLAPPSACRLHPRCPFALEGCRLRRQELLPLTPGHLVRCERVVSPDGVAEPQALIGGSPVDP